IAAFIIAQLWGGPLLSWDLQAAAASVPSWLIYVALVPLAFLLLLTFDFFYYWFHRAQHEWPWLWQVHKLHHSDRALNVTS
ncbi:MAG TPA: sterol desaturase family protein, partial [Rhodoplanes sp.]|nr:sterol desaturase family protein [Rhodoplanes sp.]